MFYGTSIGDLSALSNWRATSGTSFRNMFAGNDHLANLNGLNLLNDGSGNNADFTDMFANDTSLSNLSGLNDWDVSHGTDFSSMFANDTSLSNLSGLND